MKKTQLKTQREFLSFIKISLVQKEAPRSHAMQDQANDWQNPFRFNEKQPLVEKLPEPIESSEFVPHRARMSEKFDSRKD